MEKNTLKIFLFCLIAGLAFVVNADYPVVEPDSSITVGEFVYDDDYTPTTTPCTLTIYDSNNTLKVDGGAMSSEASGWHYYEYTVPSDGDYGVWSSYMECGTADVDLVKLDKSFEVGEIVSTSSIASKVWSNDSRTLTDYSTSTIASGVWEYSSRTLTSLAAVASDIWNAATRTLTSATLSVGSLATLSDIESATSSIASKIDDLNNISATDVWSAGTRTLTSASLSSGNLATESYIDTATSTVISDIESDIESASTSLAVEVNENESLISGLNNISVSDVWNEATASLSVIGSIGKLLVDNIDATISSRGTSDLTALDVWNSATRTLTDYSTSTIATAVWNNSTRTLTEGSLTAEDVWNTLVSSLTTVDSVGKLIVDNLDDQITSRASLSNQEDEWTVTMSDLSSVEAGETYRAKITVLNATSAPATPFSAPEATVYDAERNMVASSIPMTELSTGVYEYTYSVAGSAAQGVWETVVETEIESGKTVTTNDYWMVSGSPAQVIINSVTGDLPTATANVTITNEGLSGYEYQYEWCVVVEESNQCGGGDDVYRGTGAKYINPGEDWNTDLTATITTSGDYIFKVIAYFGVDSSGSSRTFTISEEEYVPPPAGGGGGGGGDRRDDDTCYGADFNCDGIVNSIDFSILLAFWKTDPPFRNDRVDINGDYEVDSIDFSIMLSQWGTEGIPYGG